ncbi:hypothetical protein [Massiliimalia massiliensis]|uniref:hypothetical protein n=1 Tax=Massiliimalia massiliensis TaxID=1852384 RepID=UPI000987C6CB|nr:hypothetical protein [Massiliimalia massiliensis]
MERGYWLPPNYKNLFAYDGFYIDSRAVYTRNQDTDWEQFLGLLSKKMKYRKKSLIEQCEWKICGNGKFRFVVLEDQYVHVIAEDVEDYLAIYVIIPEDCKMPGHAKRAFSGYVNALKDVLIDLYAGKVRKRVNSQHTELVG